MDISGTNEFKNIMRDREEALNVASMDPLRAKQTLMNDIQPGKKALEV